MTIPTAMLEFPAALLTDDEHQLIDLLAQSANLMRKVIGQGDQADHDWAEAAHEIHHLQHRVMAQAAARAYPESYRLMGGWPDGRGCGSPTG